MRIIRIAVILIAVTSVPFLAHAAGVQLTSSTQYLWYQDFLSNETDQSDIAEYLRLNVKQLDKDGKINVYGYGRVTWQLETSDEARPELGSDTQGRLYYLFLDCSDVLKGHLDLRAGRTYVYSAAISGTIDGAYLDFKKLGPVGATVFGGRRVIFDNKSEIGTGGDTLAGASVYFDTEKYATHVEASYGRKYAETDLAQENVGLDFSTTPHQRAGFFGRLQYDTVADKFSEILVGVKLVPLKDLILRPEYYRSRATFDKFSFFRFFNVNNYEQLSIGAEYYLTADYRVYARYAREDFDDGATADLYKIGLLARPIKALTLDASYEKRNGFAGALDGFRFKGDYRIHRATVSAGVDYDDFRREDSREGTAKKYWGGVAYELSKMFSVAGRFEHNVNFTFDHANQGFVALNVNL